MIYCGRRLRKFKNFMSKRLWRSTNGYGTKDESMSKM